MKLPLPALIALEKTLNGVVQLDPDTCTRLSAINGKRVRVMVTAPQLTMTIAINNGQITLDQSDDMRCDADATISGSLSDLRSLLNNNDAVYAGAVIIEGDIEIAQHLKHIVSSLDPDWQEAVSPWLGDSLTHYLDVTQSRFSRWLDRTSEAFRMNTGEYLQEEAQLLAPKSEIAAFCEAVDDLQASVDRFAARLSQCEKRKGSLSTSLSSASLSGEAEE